MNPRTTRREFLCGAAAASTACAAPWIVPSSARGADGAVAPSGRITLGLIGIGAMGSGHLAGSLGNRAVQMLAVCDTDRVRRESAQAQVEQAYAADRASGAYRGCTAYNDYRELLARPDIDAVIIATPDHWHALISVDAAKAGKDIYCEKPVSITIDEGRQIVEAVRRHGRVFQTGTQYRSNFTTRKVCEFVRHGGLGRIKAAFAIWSQLGEFGNSDVPVSVALPGEPVPEGLDWDLWVGPAPWRPYNSRYHRNPIPGVVPWAFCEDFGAASITYHHSHSADVLQYGLGVETGGPVEILHPAGGEFPTLTYRYANGTLLHLVYHWGQVKELYKAVPPDARLAGAFGGIFVGERGWMTSMYGGGPIEGGPEPLFQEAGLQNREISGANDHHVNWFDCIRTRGRPSSHEEIGHRSASLGHLATIAFRLGRSLRWDTIREEFATDPEANRLRSRAMREPWRM